MFASSSAENTRLKVSYNAGTIILDPEMLTLALNFSLQPPQWSF